MISHLDESGRVCERHPPAELARVMQLAELGSCAAGFHHDLASKLQGAMMAIDEISELAAGDVALVNAVASARGALHEITRLLATGRELTKSPTASKIALRDLIARAVERVGVSLTGAISADDVELSVPHAVHALALAFDVAAGAGRGRALELTSHGVEISVAMAAATSAGASESLAIAAWILARDGGELRCTNDARLIMRLPLAR